MHRPAASTAAVLAAVLVLPACASGPPPVPPPEPVAPVAPAPLRSAAARELPLLPIQLTVPGLLEYESPNAVLLAGRVYPVGWSPGGLFAYVYEPPDEACGCYFFDLVVQDLATNHIVWKYHYDSGHDDGPPAFTSLEELWRARGPELVARLDTLGIVRREDPTLRVFKPSGAGPRVAFRTTPSPEETEFGFSYLTAYRVELLGPSGPQTIFRGGPEVEVDPADLPQIGPLEVTSPGYLSSPDGARIAVLIEETWRGWEGTPHVLQLRFAGATSRPGAE